MAGLMKEEEGQKEERMKGQKKEGRMLSDGLDGNFGIIVRISSMKGEIFC